jgi:protein-disulfide isomerase
MPNLSLETKIFLAILGATAILVAGAAALLGKGGTVASSQVVDQALLTRSGSHALGPDNAKVTVVEFSDFQCPACKEAEPTVEQVRQKYQDQVRFVYREFPLPAHEFALPAAQAAEAAGLQGKFWEMHDKLFQISPDLSRDKLIEAAKSLSLDVNKFTTDLDSDQVRQTVLNDQADGNKVGLEATPTFFINGTKFTGGLTLSEFQKEIDSRLR